MTDLYRQPDAPDAAPLPLSAAGRARRDAILHAAVQELRVTQARRRRRRRFAAAAVWCAVITVSAMAAMTISDRSRTDVVTRAVAQHPRDESQSESQPRAPQQPRAHQAAVRIVQVHTRPDAAQRYAVHTPTRVDRIDDDALVTLLASINRPAGLMYVNGRAQLTRDVTDEPAGN